MTHMTTSPPDPEPPKPSERTVEPFPHYYADGSALIWSDKGLKMVAPKAPYLVTASSQTSSQDDLTNSSAGK